MKYLVNYFSKGELALWAGSVAAVLAAFLMFDRSSWITLLASLIGVTSLIFAAKGHPAAQAMAIVFALLYGAISWGFAYYGEMITYLGMSMPMAVFSLVSWLRHPSDKKDEVKVNHLKAPEFVFMAFLTIAVTIAFYFILKYFNTANLIPSTISVTTSFAAVYFVFRRSQLYAVAYAANDVVLVALWLTILSIFRWRCALWRSLSTTFTGSSIGAKWRRLRLKGRQVPVEYLCGCILQPLFIQSRLWRPVKMNRVRTCRVFGDYKL